MISQAAQHSKQFSDFSNNKRELLSNEIDNAIKFNNAILLAKINDSLQKARSLLEDFLNTSDPNKPWWQDA